MKLLSQSTGNYQLHFCESVQQGSALNPLLFIMVMDVLIEDVKDGSLMELLYADDPVLCGESLDEVTDKYGRWKNVVQRKVLMVNVSKTKGLQKRECRMIRMMCGVRLVDRASTAVLQNRVDVVKIEVMIM